MAPAHFDSGAQCLALLSVPLSCGQCGFPQIRSPPRGGRATQHSPLKQNCDPTVGSASVVVAPGAPSMVGLQAGRAGRLLIGIFTRLLLESIGKDVERPLALVLVKGCRGAWMSFWLHARGGYSSCAIGSLQQIGYDSGLGGGMGRIFLASLSLCSRCCCWSWLSVRPSF
jgi:hypothetical protein